MKADEVPAYLRGAGVVPPDADVSLTRLSGGVSGVVLRADWDGGSVVLKQPLAELAVDSEWKFDRARIRVEHDCMRALGELMPRHVPAVQIFDEERYVLGMTTMPPGGVLWKDEHDAGQADPARTLAAAELLATLHRSTFGDEQLQRRFDAQWPLIQGRLDPYHRTAALANPDVAAVVDEEIERLLATRRCLVHGDFSPKNLIAYPDRMVMLDFEVAHWGDPAFDVAFLLALMMLDGIRHSDGAFARESTGFWMAYEAAAGAAAAEPAAVVAELGCVVLGRIDGKSRLPWMTERVARRGREYAKLLLTDLRTHSVEEALLGCT